jgi:hypothetical protein
MEAVYALLGIVLGIAIDEAVRRRQREVRQPTGGVGTTAPAQSSCRFTAQDYYDR